MALTADDILSRVQHILSDEAADFWDVDKLLRHLNASQVELGNLKPDAVAVPVFVKLDEGVRQTLPEESQGFLRMSKNIVVA
jgi:hypothetical protein